jgi:Flp pilus assembly protein TadD
MLVFPGVATGQLPHNTVGSLTVYVRGPGGDPLDQAQVELGSITGQFHQQATTRAGRVTFTSLGGGTFTVTAVAAGYKTTTEQVQLIGGEANTVTVRMLPDSIAPKPEAEAGPPILAPRAKKELGKAVEALRTNRVEEAHDHLETAYRLAPGNPDVNYIYGLYCARVEDWENAESHLEKVLKLYPKHTGAMISLATLLLRENKTTEAISYYKNAVELEPSSWRAHALLADALLRQGAADDAVAEAERAAELGPGQAPIVEPLLARALARGGNTQRAMLVLEAYLQNHPADTAAARQLAELQATPEATPAAATSAMQPEAALPISPAIAKLAFLPPPSVWMPPDIDDNIPPVDRGASCALDEVLEAAGKRVQEFVGDVDRFTATESITHETVNKWGLASGPEKFKFDYVVSIREVGPKLFDVEEYRPRAYTSDRFPDGVERLGLPTLMLIFHPYYAGNFEMVCEGLARWNGRQAWQIHFRQRSDRPNTIREYRMGGASYPAALKGRAWIAADTFQIVRLETDLIAPMPQIRLVADHASVEYGPVNFRARNVDLWLPQHAEFYYDWLGHRGHRVHRFQNYFLFSVTDKEHISAPKVEDTSSLAPGE